MGGSTHAKLHAARCRCPLTLNLFGPLGGRVGGKGCAPLNTAPSSQPAIQRARNLLGDTADRRPRSRALATSMFAATASWSEARPFPIRQLLPVHPVVLDEHPSCCFLEGMHES
jgi:hypothetical protein